MNDLDSRQHVIQSCRDHDVKFIRLWFTDILGMLKSVAITAEELEHALVDGVSFDGSAIEGFARHDEADMIAVPDPATFQILPWRPREQSVARMFCDIRAPDGEPFEGDPRWVLKHTLAAAAESGYTFYVSPEIEYFYFKDGRGTEPLDRGGYFDLTPFDTASDLRRQTVLTLEEMGIAVAESHHEAAPSQHEMDLRYADALTMADAVMTFRLVVKEVAMRHGVYATFMPKPLASENGSAMHLNQSLFRGESNAFHDAGQTLHLSAAARHYMAGLLRHAPDLMLVTNQWVNSYKRLVPGYEAPTHATWSTRNRADLVRVPERRPSTEVEGTRIEYRVPDSACNPYLAFAAVLAAGMAGVRNSYALPEPLERGVADHSAEELAAMGVLALPTSLEEAIDRFESSALMREALGEHVWSTLVTNKRLEWQAYRSQVTQYEIDRYLVL
ncbi:MAG: glutamine synthetase [Candidatus Rokubacteria bacterium]|nr:glutamine synthetase [Chloroflexota bacterium]MBM4441876.1 glutamine synthetase [Candidatus Rokubacteria bacterium]